MFFSSHVLRRYGAIALLCAGGCLGSSDLGVDEPLQLRPPIGENAVATAASTLAAFCCDPDKPLPQTVGAVILSFQGETPTRYAFKFDNDDGVIVADPASGIIEPSETTKVITIRVTRCDFDVATIRLKTFYVGEEDQTASSQSQTLTVNNICGPGSMVGAGTMGAIAEEIATGAGDLVRGAVVTGPSGVPTMHSSTEVPDKVPSLPGTDIVQSAWTQVVLTLSAFQILFEGLDPPSFLADPDAVVLEPTIHRSNFRDEYAIGFFRTDGDIPLSGSRTLQYAFVFDSIAFNQNFLPMAPFDNDFFRDTDRWYTANYNPLTGWSFRVTSVSGNVATEVESNARAVISKDGILMVFPLEEFGAFFPRYRVTAFSHNGDFGLVAPNDWSGDTQPPVDEPLIDPSPPLTPPQ